MKGILARPIRKVPALNGRRVTTLFYEASTRTRVSFETAARNLSADVVSISTATSSVTKGESLVDTIRTLEALGAEILVMRHSVSGAPYLAAEVFGGHVLNGGDGWHAHPTQALLDLYTMREKLGHGSARPQGGDRRRHPPLARGAVQHLVADRGRRGSLAVRPGHACCGVWTAGPPPGAAARSPATVGST